MHPFSSKIFIFQKFEIVATLDNYVDRIRFLMEAIFKIQNKYLDFMIFGGNYCAHTVL
jgi:hypothetical protein